MNLLLAAEETARSDRLLLQYLIYAAVIVAGVLLLVLLNRITRPPKHTELKSRLQTFAEALDRVPERGENAYEKLKTVAKLIYQLDKLVYVSFTMSQKERDADLDSFSVMLEGARNELTAYKASKCEVPQRLTNAQTKIGDAAALLDRIIERDRTIEKKNRK